jgi:lysophospholipase L1-like esterase
LLLAWASIGAQAAPLRIVAIGASNTHGWYVGNQGAYPAQLQVLLRAKGIDAQITNAGVPFETTGMMNPAWISCVFPIITRCRKGAIHRS